MENGLQKDKGKSSNSNPEPSPSWPYCLHSLGWFEAQRRPFRLYAAHSWRVDSGQLIWDSASLHRIAFLLSNCMRGDFFPDTKYVASFPALWHQLGVNNTILMLTAQIHRLSLQLYRLNPSRLSLLQTPIASIGSPDHLYTSVWLSHKIRGSHNLSPGSVICKKESLVLELRKMLYYLLQFIKKNTTLEQPNGRAWGKVWGKRHRASMPSLGTPLYQPSMCSPSWKLPKPCCLGFYRDSICRHVGDWAPLPSLAIWGVGLKDLTPF